MIQEQEDETENVHKVMTDIKRFKAYSRVEVEDFKTERKENTKMLEKKLGELNKEIVSVLGK